MANTFLLYFLFQISTANTQTQFNSFSFLHIRRMCQFFFLIYFFFVHCWSSLYLKYTQITFNFEYICFVKLNYFVYFSVLFLHTFCFLTKCVGKFLYSINKFVWLFKSSSVARKLIYFVYIRFFLF